MIDRKLVWLHFQAKLVEFINLDELAENKKFNHDGDDKVGWAYITAKGFSVKGVIETVHDENEKRGVSIEEVGEESILRRKKTVI